MLESHSNENNQIYRNHLHQVWKDPSVENEFGSGVTNLYDMTICYL